MITERINAATKTWWLARGPFARVVMKAALGIVAIGGVLVFFSFNMHGESSMQKGSKLRITVGQPGPWLQIETIGAPVVTTNAAGQVTSASQRAESYVNVFTWSFAAGLAAYVSLVVLSRIRLIEKPKLTNKEHA